MMIFCYTLGNLCCASAGCCFLLLYASLLTLQTTHRFRWPSILLHFLSGEGIWRRPMISNFFPGILKRLQIFDYSVHHKKFYFFQVIFFYYYYSVCHKKSSVFLKGFNFLITLYTIKNLWFQKGFNFLINLWAIRNFYFISVARQRSRMALK